MPNSIFLPGLSIVVLLATVLAAAEDSSGQSTAPLPQGVWDFSAWKLDEVALRSGKVVEGLIEKETPGEVRLLEICRPEGRGTFGVSRPLARGEIVDIRRITPQERQQSKERFEQFLNRGRVEAIRLENLPLEAFKEAGQSGWRYRGQWFTLESYASEELTRLFILRLEQTFAAYLRVLPPRATRREDLRIVIFGASESYQALARSLGGPLQNAAFYHPPRNLVAAGSDLSRLAAQLQQIQTQHHAVRADLERSRRDMPQRLEQRRTQLAVSLSSETARRKALTNYRRQLEQDIARLERTLEEYDRTNEATFQQQAGRTLALLRHEAFHAYLENYLYPQARHNVPRWLNEGLAQLFESGVLEGDTFRVDVPSKSALVLLQADSSKQAASLAQLLSADHRSFLASHDRDRGTQVHYAGAWGLADYLTFVRPVLGGRAMDEYVQPDAGSVDPTARFEVLVDQPLPEFEAQWRQWIQSQASR